MKLYQTKIIVPFSIVILLSLALAGYFLFMNKANEYFIVSGHNPGIREGSPVFIENQMAGKIEEVVNSSFTPAMQIIKFSLSADFSIPANSSFQVVNDEPAKGGFLKIYVFASKYYYQPGDTIYLMNRIPDEDNVHHGAEEDKLGQEVVVVYKIQLAASNSKIPIDSPGFRGIDNIFELLIDGTYKYYTGYVKSFAEAKKLKKIIVEKGIDDAFIVPFINDERISIHQALDYEK